MGGRLALQLVKEKPDRFIQTIAISAHPGISDEIMRKERLHDDLKLAKRLETGSFEEFLTSWYAQPIFASFKKKEVLFNTIYQRRKQQNPKALACALRKFSIGALPFISSFPHAYYFYGEEDLKYEDLYHTLLPCTQVKKIEGCGHVVHLENPKKCVQAILKLKKIRGE